MLLGFLCYSFVVVQWDGDYYAGENGELTKNPVSIVEVDCIKHRVLPDSNIAPDTTTNSPRGSSSQEVVVASMAPKAPAANIFKKQSNTSFKGGISHKWLLYQGEAEHYEGDALLICLGGSLGKSLRLHHGDKFENELDYEINETSGTYEPRIIKMEG